ncbi:thiamine pyrophosphate-dependent enzyme, partial [Acinetobacter baumannii]
RPANLTIVVLDNGLYGETGAQQSHTATTDLAAAARACGIDDAAVVSSEAELARLAADIGTSGQGPRVRIVKIDVTENARLVPLREGAHAKV